jgi:hypothetical protein
MPILQRLLKILSYRRMNGVIVANLRQSMARIHMLQNVTMVGSPVREYKRCRHWKHFNSAVLIVSHSSLISAL